MADILADYREWSDAQPRAIKTHGDRCHMWHERCMIDRLADALGRARLTDEEREAVAYYVGTGGPDAVDATLRGLLERLK